MQQTKFSLLAYAGEKNQTGIPASTDRMDGGIGTQSDRRNFETWVEEIRGELAAARGKTEEEKQQYTELLNRAVLGYEEDRFRILMIIQDQLAKRRLHSLPPPDSRYGTLAEAIFAEVIGMNVLELLLKNKEGLEEIQVVGTKIFEVRGGSALPSPFRMQSVKDLERIQQNLVLFNNDTLNPRKRWAEVMLRDGSRVTMTGFGFTAEPTLTIRFYTMKLFDLDTLALPELDTISKSMKNLIRCIIRSCFNMVVTGPTNSGKTNLIKAFIAEMPEQERIITIESRYELMLKRDFPMRNIIEYEVDEDDERHSGDQAFKLALRQSPKRICHAEIRDEDAAIYVRACTRGHDGSITTIHASQLEDVPEAITDMCMMDSRGMDPGRLVRRIAEFVTQIGFEMAVVDGKRKLVRIGEFEYASDRVEVRDLVLYDYERDTWEFPCRLSEKARRRMARYDPAGWEKLRTSGMISE